MGGHPYWYFVPFQPNAQVALDELREREFRAGRYSPVMLFPPFPLGPDSPAPGNKHRSIAAAMDDAEESGTRSILDLNTIGEEAAFCTARRMQPEELHELFGTDKPTREMVEGNMDFFEQIERGQGVCFVVYANDRLAEIFFAGYSFD